MVNLDKWSEVEHVDVKVGDNLKVVVVTKSTSPAVTKEVYKGRVTSISCGDIYLSDHSGWEDVEDANSDTTIYRRNEAYSKPFKLPTKFGSVVSGIYLGQVERVWLVFDGADWSCQDNAFTPSRLEERFRDLRVERKGMKFS